MITGKNRPSFEIDPLESRRMFDNAAPPFITRTGTLVVEGTVQADTISVKNTRDRISIDLRMAGSSGDGLVIVGRGPAKNVKRLLVVGGDGNDQIDVSGFARRATVYGGAGNDDITGGRDCTLVGGGGKDRLTATNNIFTTPVVGGVPTLNFKDENIPSLLSGGLGNDTLTAFGPDSVVGGEGNDVFRGQYYASPGAEVAPVDVFGLVSDQQGTVFSGVETPSLRISTLTVLEDGSVALNG